MSAAAAAHAAASLVHLIASRGKARVVVATAASQLEFQRALADRTEVDWSKVEIFQLDEYLGLPLGHPASFRKLLYENVVEPTGTPKVHVIDPADAVGTREALKQAITNGGVDLAFLGIGENGHLAFNDPPADFQTTDPYIVVTLDKACRQQQVGEGWFATIDDVPKQAVSMSIRQMLSAREIIVIVPDARKAEAVRGTLEADVSPHIPASILRTHRNVTLYVDEPAASLLKTETKKQFS